MVHGGILRIVGPVCMIPLLPWGCVTDPPPTGSALVTYQRNLAQEGPQQRLDTEGADPNRPLGLLLPVEPDVEPNDLASPPATTVGTGKTAFALSLKEAIAKTLANSPEIRVVSFDPEVAAQELVQQQAEFDPAVFGRVNYAYDDTPKSSPSEIGLRDERLFESGLRGRDVRGGEWSTSYLLTRTWDDLPSRSPETRYEPVLAFQLRQPLLRDFGRETTLAGVDVARLQHQVALTAFRQRAEEVAAGVIQAYWQYYLAQEEVHIFEDWLAMAKDTLEKVEGRQGIDATAVQIKQAESDRWTRQAGLIQAQRRRDDARDTLLRLVADADLNLLSERPVELATPPLEDRRDLDHTELLEWAMLYNPRLVQARLAVAIADINIRVARNQRMPKLDLVASAGTQTLDAAFSRAHSRFGDGDHYSAAVGVTVEYPLANRARKAEYTKRLIEKRKSVATLQNLADQVAEQTRQAIRRVEVNFQQIEIQRQAVEAARVHLGALEETEEIREKLTPEYLIVKLQAQDRYSSAQREQLRTLLEYNIALSQLAQVSGTLLNMHKMVAVTPRL